MEQGLLFDFPKFKITKKIRLIELFGGIGSQAMALRDIGADFEHYRLVEFDKYAVQSYNAIHKTDFTTTDIRDVHGADLGITDKDLYCYLVTYSFPCTDLSVAGKMKGMSKKDWESRDSTRSGLLWEVERILKELPKEQLPDVLLMENVPQVHADQNIIDFENWQKFLRSIGYYNFYKDLNAKDYGIPQNRERCFMVSILSDEFIEYEFPEGVKLEKVMKDFLEEQVDEKYYINSEKAEKLVSQLLNRNVIESNITTADLSLKAPKKTNMANCITARENRGISNVQGIGNAVIEKEKARLLGGLEGHERKGGGIQTGYQVFDPEYICPTQLADGGGYGLLITEKQSIRTNGKDYAETTEIATALNARDYKGFHESFQASNGVIEKIKKVGQISIEGSQCKTVVSDEGLEPTLSAGTHGYANAHIATQYRIRKLTPRECWRLMGYTDADFEKAHNAGVSNSQLYKQAGNAIVKQVLMAIFSQML